MKEAERAALSMRLAEAIGWPNIGRWEDHAVVWEDGMPSLMFDYRDPTVWGPLLKRLMEQHNVILTHDYGRFCWLSLNAGGGTCSANTIEEAIAMLVLAIKEQQRVQREIHENRWVLQP